MPISTHTLEPVRLQSLDAAAEAADPPGVDGLDCHCQSARVAASPGVADTIENTEVRTDSHQQTVTHLFPVAVGPARESPFTLWDLFVLAEHPPAFKS